MRDMCEHLNGSCSLARRACSSLRSSWARLAPVMVITVAERMVIEGGASTNPWVPKEIKVVMGAKFVPLSAGDRHLVNFIGVDPAGYLHRLRERRNHAVDALILQHLRANDPMSRYSRLPAKARNLVEAHDLPPFVTVDMPTVHGDGDQPSTPAMPLKFITEMVRNRMVSVEAEPAALRYIQAATIQHGGVGKRVCCKRKTVCDAKGVLCDKRRKVVFVLWMDPSVEGSPAKRVARKPEGWDQFHIDLAARDLAADRDLGFPNGFGEVHENALEGEDHDDGDIGSEEEPGGIAAMEQPGGNAAAADPEANDDGDQAPGADLNEEARVANEEPAQGADALRFDAPSPCPRPRASGSLRHWLRAGV